VDPACWCGRTAPPPPVQAVTTVYVYAYAHLCACFLPLICFDLRFNDTYLLNP